MTNLVSSFINKVSERNELQKKYLVDWAATEVEKDELDIVLKFFIEELHHQIDFIVDAYLFINKTVMEETYYFVRHGQYRNTTFEEVGKNVYFNHGYMEKYMMGLSVSDYVWINHIKLLRYFDRNLDLFSGGGYLEIGPGFGQYLVRILLRGNFKEYTACDISKTAVEKSNRYLEYRNLSDRCVVIEKDFFEFESAKKFDCIVMGEVLEHVERPLLMLEKIYSLLQAKGKAFITTVINAPAVDHIFLFSNIDQVLEMIESVNFKVLDYLCVTEGDIPLDRAVKKRQTINIALILEK